jgi:hypothetical protein
MVARYQSRIICHPAIKNDSGAVWRSGAGPSKNGNETAPGEFMLKSI